MRLPALTPVNMEKVDIVFESQVTKVVGTGFKPFPTANKDRRRYEEDRSNYQAT